MKLSQLYAAAKEPRATRCLALMYLLSIIRLIRHNLTGRTIVIRTALA